MNDYELIQIENAFEDAADLMQEQDLSLTETLEEVAFIHDNLLFSALSNNLG
jgi:hypothetical protein